MVTILIVDSTADTFALHLPQPYLGFVCWLSCFLHYLEIQMTRRTSRITEWNTVNLNLQIGSSVEFQTHMCSCISLSPRGSILASSKWMGNDWKDKAIKIIIVVMKAVVALVVAAPTTVTEINTHHGHRRGRYHAVFACVCARYCARYVTGITSDPIT